MKKILLLIALCGIAAGTAFAERADSNKPTTIDADSAEIDDVKQIQTLTGNVVLTRGTLVMKAGSAVVRQDPQGYQYVTFTAAPGTVASFRQKRDGGDLWIEGEAERIEYDNKNEVVKLMSKARLRELEGKRVTKDVNGAFISYDSRREVSTIRNTSSGESKPGGGRVRIVIEPSNTQPAPAEPGK